jgi:CBS domain containing-hemolysin-like protein
MDDLSATSLLLRASAVMVLVAANAFFVAAEFALVAARRTRIEAMVRRGDAKAKAVKKAVQSLDRYISGTQLGITLASLGLGWIGEPAVARVLEAAFQNLPGPLDRVATHAVAATVAFLLITFLHIVLGELAPKAVALLYPETTSRWVAWPLIQFTTITNPFIWILNGTANRLVRLFGARPVSESERVHAPEEILMLLEQSQKSGRIARQDVKFIEGVFEFTEKTAKDVMTPRTQVVALANTLTVREAAERVAQTGRSRYPVYRGSLDDIVGVVHAKQILSRLLTRPEDPVESIAREALFVPGTREVEDVLADMKRLKTHIAIVLDEYGGTAGIVTMEDLLEEIVGQIYDEYDRSEPAAVAAADGIVLPGSLEIEEANERYHLGLSEEEYQTVGGYVFGKLGRLPKAGDRVPIPGGTLEVLEMDGKRVGRIKLTRTGSKTGTRPFDIERERI